MMTSHHSPNSVWGPLAEMSIALPHNQCVLPKSPKPRPNASRNEARGKMSQRWAQRKVLNAEGASLFYTQEEERQVADVAFLTWCAGIC